MKISELKQLMEAQNAHWNVSPNIADDAELEKVSLPFALGALTPAPGVLTARFPRMRRTMPENYALWQPNLPRMLRPIRNTLPKSWDWRDVHDSNWLSTVKNQKECGSCVAFGVSAALESHQRISKNNPNLNIDISEAALFFIPERQCKPTDPRYGWTIPAALDFLMDEGACFEENFPYHDVNQNAELIKGTELTFKITGYDSTTQIEQMKRWLCEDGPLVAGFTVYRDFYLYWDNGAQGVYTHVRGDYLGGHVIMVIGYDDAQSCWICKNSWGPTGGNDGCFRIKYGQCEIDNRMYLIQDPYEVYTRDETPYNPNKLRIVDEGSKGWLLTDGVIRLKMLDNKEDARNALRIARRHTRHGFVGNNNSRSDRDDYITEYWTGSSGLPSEPLTKVYGIPYNPAKVIAEDIDEKGWRIKESNQWMLLADDLNDALAILQIVERHTRICFIGKDNPRPNRKLYMMTYWE